MIKLKWGIIMIDEEIKELVLLAQKIIKDYLIYSVDIDDEQQALVDKIFARTPVMYDNINVNARSYHSPQDRKIVVNSLLKYNHERVLSFLIHEYAHMFMERNTDIIDNLLPKWLGEGVADTFADLVINSYFKYEEATVDGRTLDFKLPYISYSAYIFENSFVRTLLYPLEKQGKDMEAIKEILLGSPKKFIEMVTNKEFSEQIEYYESGVPKYVDISIKDMYLNNEDFYRNINTSSLYYLKNFILPAFRINEKIEDLDDIKAHELKENEMYNALFIQESYFHNRPLYSIYPEELKTL